jgi:hypothetical protein
MGRFQMVGTLQMANLMGKWDLKLWEYHILRQTTIAATFRNFLALYYPMKFCPIVHSISRAIFQFHISQIVRMNPIPLILDTTEQHGPLNIQYIRKSPTKQWFPVGLIIMAKLFNNIP